MAVKTFSQLFKKIDFRAKLKALKSIPLCDLEDAISINAENLEEETRGALRDMFAHEAQIFSRYASASEQEILVKFIRFMFDQESEK